MRPPYVTGEKPDINSTLESAKTLDRHLRDAIRDLGPAKGMPMSTIPVPGSFAASLKNMMDEARSGIVKARADGLSQVTAAVDKLNEAKADITRVTDTMAKTIADEAAAVKAELGQISNLPPE